MTPRNEDPEVAVDGGIMSSPPWSFHNPTRILAGRESRSRLGQEIAGRQVLAVSTTRGRSQFESDVVLGPLAGHLSWIDSVSANPDILDIENAVRGLSTTDFDVVVAFGGGSAMDFAKAVASRIGARDQTFELRALISQPESLLTAPPVPVVALPTTAGTGSEVTPFATIWDRENKKKLSLASPALFPAIAIVDAELTDNLPAAATFASGLDALNQAFESVWNKNRSPLTVQLASRAIALALRALNALHEDLGNKAARDQLSEASVLAGLCISQTRTALCHSMSYPLTAHFDIPHGVACAFTMGEVLQLCVEHSPELFDVVIQHTSHHSAEDLLASVRQLLITLSVSKQVRNSVAHLQSVVDVIPEMAAKGRADNFVLDIDFAELEKIIRAAWIS